jgi:cytochrome c6
MRTLLVAATAAALSLAPSVRAADAAALFASRCAVCHGKDGKGSAAGKKMGVADLAAEQQEPVAEIAADIAKGKGRMPGFAGRLSPEEIQALARYVKAGLK